MMEQNLARSFLRYVSMSICSMLGISCYVLADTYFIANGVGSAGLAALNIAIPAYMMISACGLLLGMGGATLFSIETGRKSTKEILQSIFTTVIVLGVGVGALLAILGWAIPNRIAYVLGATEGIRPFAAVYIRTMGTFAPAFVVSQILVCFVRNDGQPNLAMAAMIVSSFSNIVLDYVFVYPLRMGMFGAALATGISPVISISISLCHWFRKENHLRLNGRSMAKKWIVPVVKTGTPHFIGEISSGIVICLFNVVIGKIGEEVAIAAYGIIANVALVILAIFNGISQGVQPLMGRSFGAGKQENLKKLFYLAAGLALLLGGAFYAFCALGAAGIVKLFNKEGLDALVEITVPGIRVYFSAFLFAGINVVAATYFSVILCPKAAFLNASLRGFLLPAPLVLLFAAWFGITGVWLSVPAAECLTLLIVLILYRKQKNGMR